MEKALKWNIKRMERNTISGTTVMVNNKTQDIWNGYTYIGRETELVRWNKGECLLVIPTQYNTITGTWTYKVTDAWTRKEEQQERWDRGKHSLDIPNTSQHFTKRTCMRAARGETRSLNNAGRYEEEENWMAERS